MEPGHRNPIARRQTPIPAPKQRHGITQLELLVAVSIMALLTALLLPAVQQVRQTSRKTQCSNNLRQLGQAHHQAVDVYKLFPTDVFGFAYLAPYYERSDILDKFLKGESIYNLSIPLLYCPADPLVPHGETDRLSYVVNEGNRFRHSISPTGDLLGTRNGVRREWQHVHPVLGQPRGTAPSEITDGLSNTALLSERLGTLTAGQQQATSRHNTLRRLWYTELAYQSVGDEPLAIEQCLHHRTQYSVNDLVSSGADNSQGYLHLIPPNHHGCVNAAIASGVAYRDFLITAPTSLHPSGVNLLLADGAVRFVTESVSLETWSALGSIDSGDHPGEF